MFDICVVGAGFAGTFLALYLQSLGFKVCLIDKTRKYPPTVPSKFVTFRVTREFLAEFGLDDEEYIEEGFGVQIFGPGLKPVSFFESHYLIVDRKRILSDAINEFESLGGKFLRGFEISIVKAKDDCLVLPEADVECSLVVDASGVFSKLRESIARRKDWHLDDDKLVVEHVFEIEGGDGGLFATYDPAITEKGFVWWASVHGRTIVAIRELPTECEELIARFLFFKKLMADNARWKSLGDVIHPMFRPPYSLVSNGFLLVGEAAYQANPIFSSGIYESLLAAKIASESLKNVDLSRAPTEEDLWNYNKLYFERAGRYLLAFYAVARFLKRLSPQDIVDFLEIVPKRVSKNIGKIVAESFEALTKFFTSRVFWRTYELSTLIRKLLKVGEKYPGTPQELGEWEKETEELIKKANYIV